MPESTKKESHYLRYHFTEDELNEKGRLLALSVSRKAAAEVEKASVMSDFTTRIKKEIDTASRLTENMNSGWEMRNITCRVLFDDPKPGKASVVREDTGEIVEVRDMTKDERQGTLQLISSPREE